MSLLIITSSVTVNSCLTVLVDPKIRLEQYIDSILFYLNSKKVKKIIVCDNSGFDYSEIQKIVELAAVNNKQIEFLSFYGTTDKIQECGKGYGEGEIISFVFSNSKIIAQGDVAFLKVTGRLKILNIDEVVHHLKSNVTYFNAVNLNPFVNLKKVDTRFYQCTKENFKYFFKDSYKNVNDKEGFFLEHVYYNNLQDNIIKFKNFKILPNFSGISGSTGITYKTSKISFLIRQFLFSVFRVIKNK